MALRELTTADQVIDALGGSDVVMTMTGAKWNQSVSGWRTKNRFPSRTYVLMTEALKRIGYSAPDSLWGQIGLVPGDDSEECEEADADA